MVTKRWIENEAVGASALRKQYIPPVTTQLMFLNDDIEKGLVKPTGEDIYIVWSGANDLLANFRNITGFNKETLHALEQILWQAAVENANNAKAMLKNKSLKTRTVYVIDQFNPKLTPMLRNITGGEALGKLIGEHYNSVLKAEIEAYNLFHPFHTIHYVSAWDMFEEILAEHPQYFTKSYDSLGLPVACPVPANKAQEKENCKGYAFQYDGEHPTSTTHQQFAVKMFRYIERNPPRPWRLL